MIYGERTRLRLPAGEEDHRLMVAWRTDPAIKPYFYNDEPISLESHMRWWAKVSQDLSQRNYMVDGCVDGKYIPIGMTALMNLDFINRTGEYARFKIDPRYQGQGFATDAERTLMCHAFNALNLNRVWLHALEPNEPLFKLHARTGFVIEGRLRQHIYKEGRWRDVVVMGLLAEEFRHPKMTPEELERMTMG